MGAGDLLVACCELGARHGPAQGVTKHPATGAEAGGGGASGDFCKLPLLLLQAAAAGGRSSRPSGACLHSSTSTCCGRLVSMLWAHR